MNPGGRAPVDGPTSTADLPAGEDAIAKAHRHRVALGDALDRLGIGELRADADLRVEITTDETLVKLAFSGTHDVGFAARGPRHSR